MLVVSGGCNTSKNCCFCVLWTFISIITILCVILELFRVGKHPPKIPDPYYPTDHLEVGIYWFGKNNARNASLTDNPYFNVSAKKVMIFTHGWAVESVKFKHRETFQWLLNDPKYGLDMNTANAWIDDGWLMGIFYWSQLAAEPHVDWAESKIWTTEGPRGMRWLQLSGDFTHHNSPNVSVADLYATAYADALSQLKTKPEEIRLVGHSLGSQLTIRTAHIVAQKITSGELDPALQVRRIALLDPYFYTSSNRAEPINKMVEALIAYEDIVFVNYKTSYVTSWPLADPDKDLQQVAAFVYREPSYSSVLDLTSKHVAAPNLYFLSYKDEIPMQKNEAGNNQGRYTPSPKSSIEKIKSTMGKNVAYQQVSGMRTQDTKDDEFQVYNPVHANLDIMLLISFIVTCVMVAIVSFTLHECSSVGWRDEIQHEGHPLTSHNAHRWTGLGFSIIQCFLFIMTGIIYISLSKAWYTRNIVLNLLAIIWIVRPCIVVMTSHLGYHHLPFISRFDGPNAPLCCDFEHYLFLSGSSRAWFWISQTVFLWLSALPMIVFNSIPVNSHNIDMYDAITWAFIVIGILIEGIADNETSSNACSLVTGEEYIYDSSLFVVSSDGTFGKLWKMSQNPHLLGELIVVWSLYFAVSRQMMGAVFDNYVYVALLGPITTTLSILLYRIPRSYMMLKKVSTGIDGENISDVPILFPMPLCLYRFLCKLCSPFQKLITVIRVNFILFVVLIMLIVMYTLRTDSAESMT